MFTRTKATPVPEVGAEAPEFNLPSAQGGQLRLSMRTVRGPVVVIFYRPWSAEDVEYFKKISGKEDEINMAASSVVGIGVAEPDEARKFVRVSGIKSYVLYDYVKVTTSQWGLLESDKQHGDYSRPAVFIVGADHNIAHAWLDERPGLEEILAKISELTGLPKPAEEEAEEKPEKEKDAPKETVGEESVEEAKPAAPKKLSAEEREKIKAERRAAREAGKSLKTPNKPDAPSGDEEKPGETEAGAPKKMSKEERDRIKAERRAAREAGKSLKSGASAGKPDSESAPEEPPAKKPEQSSGEKASAPQPRESGGESESEGSAPEAEAQAGTPDAESAESGAGDAAGDEETAEERSKKKPAEGE